LAQGHRLGELARLRWPGHVLVREPAAHHERAVRTTSRLIADPSVPALCEAAFAHEGVRVRVDVLVRRSEPDTFDLIEVKSSARAKPEHATDIGVQLHVVESSGLYIERVGLLHVDADYLWQGGAYDCERLFRLTDLTDAARAAARDVAQNVARLRALLDADRPPSVDVGAHCHSPYACPFFGHCARAPGSRADAVPLDQEPLAIELEQIDYPIAFVAPLVALPALPMTPATRPYERIAIGWALSVMGSGGRTERQRFVARDLERCGGEALAALATALPAKGGIVVYAARDRDWLASALPIAEATARVTALSPALGLIIEGLGKNASAAAAHATIVALTGAPSGRAGGGFNAVVDVTSAAVEAFDVTSSRARRRELRSSLERAAEAEVDALTELFGWLCDVAGAGGEDD
jgi:hypothetical protein